MKKHESSNNISRWLDGKYRVYTEDRELYERLVRRKDCRPHGVYLFPDGGRAWDVIVGESCIESVRKLLQNGRTTAAAKSQAQTKKVTAKRGLNDKELRGSKSP